MEDILKAFEPPVNPNIPELRTGDTVNVQVKIREGNRERIQEFRGTVLFVHNNGANSTFTEIGRASCRERVLPTV